MGQGVKSYVNGEFALCLLFSKWLPNPCSTLPVQLLGKLTIKYAYKINIKYKKHTCHIILNLKSMLSVKTCLNECCK